MCVVVERLHRWLLENRLFAEDLHHAEEKQGIPRKSKGVAFCLMWAALGILIWAVHLLSIRAARIERLLQFGANAVPPR